MRSKVENVRLVLTSLVMLMALLLAACGQSRTGGRTASVATSVAVPGTMGVTTDTQGMPMTTLTIANQGEQLLFDKKQLGPIPTGKQITLKFTNDSTIHQHNWILLNTDDPAVAAAFDEEAAAAGEEAMYLPADTSLVLASSQLLSPGTITSDIITFTAPAPGRYIYICTVPGHYGSGMWGELIVVP